MFTIKQISFRASEEEAKNLRIKVLQEGTTIQEVFHDYLTQYLSGKTVFVNQSIKVSDVENIKKIMEDTETLLKRIEAAKKWSEFVDKALLFSDDVNEKE